MLFMDFSFTFIEILDFPTSQRWGAHHLDHCPEHWNPTGLCPEIITVHLFHLWLHRHPSIQLYSVAVACAKIVKFPGVTHLWHREPGQKRQITTIFLRNLNRHSSPRNCCWTLTEPPLGAPSQIASWCGTVAAQLLKRRTYTNMWCRPPCLCLGWMSHK